MRPSDVIQKAMNDVHAQLSSLQRERDAYTDRIRAIDEEMRALLDDDRSLRAAAKAIKGVEERPRRGVDVAR